MMHTCTICNTAYDYSPDDMHSINLVPNVCSGKCFTALLRRDLTNSTLDTLHSPDIFYMSSGTIVRNEYEEKVRRWFRDNQLAVGYEEVLFKPEMYVPDFILDPPDYPGYVFIEAKGLWSGKGYKKVREFREWLLERNTNIYVIDSKTFGRINGKE